MRFYLIAAHEEAAMRLFGVNNLRSQWIGDTMLDAVCSFTARKHLDKMATQGGKT